MLHLFHFLLQPYAIIYVSRSIFYGYETEQNRKDEKKNEKKERKNRKTKEKHVRNEGGIASQ
jgi:hypothetical protein